MVRPSVHVSLGRGDVAFESVSNLFQATLLLAHGNVELGLVGVELVSVTSFKNRARS